MSQNIYVVLLILCLTTVSSVTVAKHDGLKGHDHESKRTVDNPVDEIDVTVLPGEAVIIVHGIVCSFCSQGVTRNLSKLPFVERSKYTKGVKVEIESQKVTIAIKAEAEIDLPLVFKSILKGGYEPVEAYVRNRDGKVTFHRANGE
jgi:hypothetical protein